MHITVLGLGNTLFSDEGVGMHVLPLLEEALRAAYGNRKNLTVEVVEGGTDGLRLIVPVEDAENLIVVDAVEAKKPFGTVLVIEGEENIPVYYGVRLSAHEIGLPEILFGAKIRGRLPKRVALVGVQPASLEVGLELTDTVRAKLPEVVEAVLGLVDRWVREELGEESAVRAKEDVRPPS